MCEFDCLLVRLSDCLFERAFQPPSRLTGNPAYHGGVVGRRFVRLFQLRKFPLRLLLLLSSLAILAHGQDGHEDLDKTIKDSFKTLDGHFKGENELESAQQVDATNHRGL